MHKYKKILYKLSGEVLKGSSKNSCYDAKELEKICQDIARVHSSKIKICVTVGGGNIIRGRNIQDVGIDRLPGDSMGMLATVINAIAIQSKLHQMGVSCTVFSAIQMDLFCKFYNREDALSEFKTKVLIFAGGIANPLFSTDTGSAIRAFEMGCDVLIKGTNVDGVYSADPKKDPKARFYDKISYQDVISQNLGFMDRSASEILLQAKIPTIIFSAQKSSSPLYELLTTNLRHTVVK